MAASDGMNSSQSLSFCVYCIFFRTEVLIQYELGKHHVILEQVMLCAKQCRTGTGGAIKCVEPCRQDK
jgi:hypothetical protein